MGHVKYWAALHRVPRMGTVRFRRLEAYFVDLEHAWNASLRDLKAAGLEDRVANEIVAARQHISPDEEMEASERAGVKVLNWHDPEYPPRLKEIHDPPPLLYYKGEILPEDERAVAVVGTRNPTAYGREASAKLSADLAKRSITIVSGLALGIDGVAHRAAIESGGRTIAVLASGLDTIYPSAHAGLFQLIQTQGAVVSECPLGVKPDRRGFPRRNRLISGMSLGSLVVEAGEGSGALWTVRHALEQNREVFCVPGSIFSPVSRGTNRLIQEGAKLVSNYLDILEELNLRVVASQIEMRFAEDLVPDPLDADESALLRHLDYQPVHIDDIRRQASLPIATVSASLTMLELKGLVRQVGCMHYIRVREASATYGN